MKLKISNFLEISPIPKQKGSALHPFDFDEKGWHNLSQGFVLEAKTRLRACIWREKEEASRLGEGKVFLIEMADHSPVIKPVKCLRLIEFVIL